MAGQPHAYNDFAHPDNVVPVRVKAEEWSSRKFEIRLPKHSFTLMRFVEE